MPNTPLPARVFLVASYVLSAAAGVVASIWPPPTVAQAGAVWAYMWGGFLVVGGLSSAFGALRRMWTGEYVGLPLLVAVWGVFGVTAGYTAVHAHRPAAWASSFALLSVACLLGYRWDYVAVYRRSARQAATRAPGDEP